MASGGGGAGSRMHDLSGWAAGLAALDTWIRGHWAIENRLHYVRDVTRSLISSASRDQRTGRTSTTPGPWELPINNSSILVRITGA